MIELSSYFSPARAAWVPCIVLWDERTGELRRVEGPEGFEDYRHAVEASRLLTLDVRLASPQPAASALAAQRL